MRIAQVLHSDVWGEVSPAALDRGIGGREGACLRLAREWARLGHEVTNFVNIKKSERHYEGSGNGNLNAWSADGFHEYVHTNLARPMLASFEYDAVICWEIAQFFDDDAIVEKQKVRLVEMQVAHFLQGQMELTEQRATGVVALSEWHKRFLVYQGLEMDESQLYVQPNGVDIGDYPLRPDFGQIPDQKSFVYSSSSDRGLWHLLKIWPQIRERWADAKLYIAYGLLNFIEAAGYAHTRQGEMAVDLIHLRKQEGVMDVGKIGRRELANAQMAAAAWLYPCDTVQPTETGCITAVEAGAAGTPIVTTDCDCLEDEFGDVGLISPLPFGNGAKFLAKIENLLTRPTLYRTAAENGRAMAEERDWSKIAAQWIPMFEENAALAA